MRAREALVSCTPVAPQPGGCEPTAFGAVREEGHSELIAPLADIARFRPDDPDALVSAALACPFCLHTETVHWHGSLEGYDPSVQCLCESCQAHWRVYVAPDQALRLGLMPAHA